MDAAVHTLVRALHDAPLRLVVAVTGGGSGAIAELLQAPGASRTVLEAIVPYSAAALRDWVGARPEHFCHERTARAMAMAAFQRAMTLDAREALAGEGQGVPSAARSPILAGIGCTASLASDRPKRGAHRVHVAVQTAAATTVHSLELTKDARTRREEEDVAMALVLNAAAEAAGLAERVELGLRGGEHVETESLLAPPAWQELLLGETRLVRYRPDADAVRSSVDSEPPPRAVFPGAFHPLHAGHRRMADVAEQMLATPVHFEISIVNVDKPPLDYLEMSRRGRQFTGRPVWFARAATFREKARLFPGATFVVGADTIVRLADPKYYGGDAGECQKALGEIASQGCRFLVFGRVAAGGRFETLDDLGLPATLAAVCRGVPADRFREDISSTELRRAEEAPPQAQ